MGKRGDYQRTPAQAGYARATHIIALLVICLCYVSFNAIAATQNRLITPQTSKNIPNTVIHDYIPASVKAANKKKAEQRLQDWQTFITTHRGKPELELIVLVNRYFNNLGFIDDQDLWKSIDYWATPYEVLREGAGDCEDHAIAKYYTLRKLGITDDQLQVAFVRATPKTGLANTINADHMVLLFTPQQPDTSKQQEIKLVLDNLTSEITNLSESSYYELGYSFNTRGVWLWKDNTHAIVYGGPDVIENWRLLRQRFTLQLPVRTAALKE